MKIQLENGQTIEVPDGLSQDQLHEVVEHASSSLGGQQSAPQQKPGFFSRGLVSPEAISKIFGGSAGPSRTFQQDIGGSPWNVAREQLPPATPTEQFMKGAGGQLPQIASSATSPLALGYLGGNLVAPGATTLASLPFIPGLLKGGIGGLAKEKQLRESGQYRQAGGAGMQGVADLLFGLLGLKGAGGMAKEVVSPTEPYGRAATPERAQIAQAAEQHGMPAMPGAVTEFGPWAGAEKILSNLISSTKTMRDIKTKQLEGATQWGEQFKQKVGTPAPEQVGAETLSGISTAAKDVRVARDAAYQSLNELAAGKKSDLPSLTSKLQEMIKEQKAPLPGTQDTGLISQMKTILGATEKKLPKGIEEGILKMFKDPNDPAIKKLMDAAIEQHAKNPEFTFDRMKATKTQLEAMAQHPDVIKTPESRVYTQLAESLGTDMDKFASTHGEEIMDAYTKAGDINRAGRLKLNDPIIRSVRELALRNPDMVASKVIKPGESVKIRNFRQLVGEQAWGKIKGQFAQNLIEGAKSAKGKQIATFLQGPKLLNDIQSYGDRTLGEVFTPDELKEVKQLASSTSMVTPQEGSGVGAMGAIRLLRPLLNVPGYPLAKILSTEIGRRAMSTNLSPWQKK